MSDSFLDGFGLNWPGLASWAPPPTPRKALLTEYERLCVFDALKEKICEAVKRQAVPRLVMPKPTARELLLAEYGRLCSALPMCSKHPDRVATRAIGSPACEECFDEHVALLEGPPPLIPGHFDTPPSDAITAEQVRADWRRRQESCPRNRPCDCEAALYHFALKGLLAHPGVSSTARAVIEAALE